LNLAKKDAAEIKTKSGDADKGTKKRVKRDKDAPKKPMSPFFCYQAVRRPQLKNEQPTLKNTEIIKVSFLSLHFSPFLFVTQIFLSKFISIVLFQRFYNEI
jgi:hypothetical protein